ncbi:MAG TPA: hypothetical protein VF911_09850 [Thermoanaerobaculia bacterium]|jgi:hypothetical protein
MDRNRDGATDLTLRYYRSSSVFDHNPPDEYWEDRDLDGHNDLHVVYAGLAVEAVWFDDDENGVFERALRGAAAQSYRALHPPRSILQPRN